MSPAVILLIVIASVIFVLAATGIRVVHPWERA
jgi:hypothetical protein